MFSSDPIVGWEGTHPCHSPSSYDTWSLATFVHQHNAMVLIIVSQHLGCAVSLWYMPRCPPNDWLYAYEECAMAGFMPVTLVYCYYEKSELNILDISACKSLCM